MLFAFKVCKHVKSNAIIYVKNKKTIGIGAGQMSRVDSAKIASQKNSEMEKSEENSLENSVVASDAFFPFADGLLVTISSGAKAVIQPGGSVKDDEVIEAANRYFNGIYWCKTLQLKINIKIVFNCVLVI